jgi:hypothetical protein
VTKEQAPPNDEKPAGGLSAFNAGLGKCETCGHSPLESANDRETQLSRLHHYRHAPTSHVETTVKKCGILCD